MPSNYPGALDSLPTNRTDSSPLGTHKTDHNNLNDALNKIEGELGTNPSSSYATVAARVTAMEAQVAAAGASAIYWGAAALDGDTTYEFYYPGLRPGGGAWGDAPWDQETWNKFEVNTAKTVPIMGFGQPAPWDAVWQSTPATLCTARGAFPCISMGPGSATFTDITAGVYDTQITTWANAARVWGKPFFLRLWWEMNGNWFPQGVQATANPTNFVNAWRHFYNVVNAAGATNVTFFWCPNHDWGSGPTFEQVYPGDAYVDWVGWDAYNKGGSSSSFTTIFQPDYTHMLSVAPSKPILIGEVAALEYGTNVKSGWITDMLSVLPSTFPQIKGFLWFNWRILDGTYQSFPIESSASATSAFAAGIASSYYQAHYTPTMVFGKVPVP